MNFALPHKLFIEGYILISAKVAPFANATVHITLENTSFQDAESVLAAEILLANIAHGAEQTVIDFKLPIKNPNLISEKHDYVVNVWINLASNGKVGNKDLFNDENYPVLTRGCGNEVTIKINT